MTKKQTGLRWVLLAVVAVLFVLVVSYPPAANALRGFVSSATQWILKPFRELGLITDRVSSGITGLLLVYRQNRELLATESRLLIDKTRLEALERENQDLKKALGIKNETKRDIWYADVIGKFAEGRDEYLIVAHDRNIEIPEGAAVFSVDGVLLGFVRVASGNTATVRTLASPSESISARILPAGVYGILKGDNNGEYLVSLIPSSAYINAGDAVVTAGRNAGVNTDTAIGSVVSVERRPTETFLEVRVRSPIEINFVDKVLISAE